MLLFLCLVSAAHLTRAFRLEFNRSDSIFHNQDLLTIETTEPFACGCHDRYELDVIREKFWSPEHFLVDHGELWLGGIEALEAKSCGQLCLTFNRRTTHFSFEGKTLFGHLTFRFFVRFFVYNFWQEIHRFVHLSINRNCGKSLSYFIELEKNEFSLMVSNWEVPLDNNIGNGCAQKASLDNLIRAPR